MRFNGQQGNKYLKLNIQAIEVLTSIWITGLKGIADSSNQAIGITHARLKVLKGYIWF